MKNCGRRFHSEVAKFKFLNELVKVISPKVRSKTRLSVKATFQSRCVYDRCRSEVFVRLSFSTWETHCQRKWRLRSLLCCTAGLCLSLMKQRSVKRIRCSGRGVRMTATIYCPRIKWQCDTITQNPTENPLLPFFILDVSSVDAEMSLDADASVPCPRRKNPVFCDEKKNRVGTCFLFP